jgi:hypothetical protein
MVRLLAFSLITFGSAIAAESTVVELCKVLATPAKCAGTEITIRATIQSSMHGTYLSQAGCDAGRGRASFVRRMAAPPAEFCLPALFSGK